MDRGSDRLGGSSEVRVLVVGLGSIGSRHAVNLQSLGVSEILAYRALGRPLPADRELPPIVECTSLEDGLARRPDAVLVCNPPSLHIPAALAAARAGAHLFIEKPLAASREGVAELAELVEREGLVSLVGFNLRFHPGLQLVKSLIDEGAVGKVVSIRADAGQHLTEWRPWQTLSESYSASRQLGGGVILDLIHEVDYVRWLGGEVAEVSCFARTSGFLGIDTEDTAEILLRFRDGGMAGIHLDYVQRPASRSCKIVGEEGTIIWDYYENEVRLQRASDAEWQISPQAGFQHNDMFVDEMRHFLACIAGREEPVVDVIEGTKVLDIALAAHESAAQGRVVSLPREGGHHG